MITNIHLEKLDLEVSRLADANQGDTNITTAIQMANQGEDQLRRDYPQATGLNAVKK